MVKKIAIGLLCTALGSSLYAGEFSNTQGFIGVEVGAATVQGDIFRPMLGGDFYLDKDHDGDAVEYGIRLGAQSDEWRTTILYDYYDSGRSDDQNIEKGFLLLDYFFYNGDAGNEYAFRPFIGVNVGYINYESTLIDEDGFVYGAQAGFAVNVAESIDLDLSYRYSLSDCDPVDHMGSIVFGVNYLY